MSGWSLALSPATLIAGVAGCAWLVPGRPRLARSVALVAVALALALLLVDAHAAFSGGVVERSFFELVPGVSLVLRADSSGLTLVCLAGGMALAALSSWQRGGREAGALLLGLLGTMVAALAGNAVLLFAGIEIAGVASLVLIREGSSRLGRGVAFSFCLQHLTSLGLLAAALQLQSANGTSDLRALTPGASPPSITLPWALAGALRLFQPGAIPLVAWRRSSSAWTSAAGPCGAIVLLRLGQIEGDPPSVSLTVGLAVAGGLAALLGSIEALRQSADARRAGRALCLAAAGPVVALAGIGGTQARGALAAGIVSLLLVLASGAAWASREISSRRSRALAVLALIGAGGLPTAFATTALMLELATLAALGTPALPVLCALTVSAALSALAAMRASLTIIASPARGGVEGTSERHRWNGGLRLDAALPIAVSAVAALAPGFAVTTVVTGLAGVGGVVVLDAAAVRAPGGGWAGGYLLVAAAISAALFLSALALTVERSDSGRAPVARADLGSPSRPELLLPLIVAARHLAARPVRRLTGGVRAIDAWLVGEPHLPLVLALTALTAVALTR
ncbi:MAG TPA: hypothetical protein VE219_06880 [Candidatus Sulfotelmatobacter sp.]|nr:hypothetical protein [Candidatus Sulfotelmatobacter sp.]